MRGFHAFSHHCRMAVALLLLCVAGAASAQTAASDAGDPPVRAARLSYLAGDVGLLPSGAKDWSDADVNRPLTDGDRLSSGTGARAELELGGAALRVAGDTDLGLLGLDGQLGQFELTRGTLELGVRSLADGQSYEIDTPTVALVVDRPGTLRVDVDPDGRATTVTAFDGNATVFGANGARQDVVAGRRYRFDDVSLDDTTISDIGGGDAFDAWCDDRDRRYTDAMTPQYVSDEMVGAEDLDNYGSWDDDPDYGEVWFPAHVDAGWAPYRFGHWVWIAPWGWTWVDDAPWGFAPFHYGRWAFIRGAWGWLPGPRRLRPVYAPALVAFVGGGRHWGLSPGLGAPVGWFPLGPHDIYDPWYRASRGYYSRVNLAGLRDRHGRSPHDIASRIERHYAYFHRGRPMPGEDYAHRHPHGFTAVPAHSFAGAHDVHRHLLHVDPRHLAGASIETHGAPVKPGRLPVRSAHARPLPGGDFHRPVVMRHVPAHGHVALAGRGGSADPRRDATPRAVAHAAPPVRPNGPRTTVRAFRGDHPVPPRPALVTHGATRPGELPSARFARQRPRSEPVQRPGVSFIGREPAPAARRPAGTLPQVPHFQRAGSAMSPQHQAAAHFEAERRMHAPPAADRPHVATPSRSYRSAPRPMPSYQRPDFRPPPRVLPERHAAPAHPPAAHGGHASSSSSGSHWRH
jgi:hypothetical protein